jgi:hypothetical protein
MKNANKIKFLTLFYFGILILLLLSVITMPLIIHRGLPLTMEFIIEEEVLETSLIVFLIGVSYFILRAFKHNIKTYERTVDNAGEEKSKLVSRLAEAFSYIGIVNVELHQIQYILSGVERYPQTKSEFNLFIDHLVTKAMTVAGTPWIVIRIIRRRDGRTVKEYAIVRSKGVIPSTTIGNREILEDRYVKGLRKIGSSQKNLDLMTVCILPKIQLSEEKNILITAITNQVELFYILYRTDFIHQQFFHNTTK